MRYIHVTELVGSRTPRHKIPRKKQEMMDFGSAVHELLAEKYRKEGWHCEETQINYLYRGNPNSKQSKIEAVLVGTPDAFKFEKGVLYVIDHKTTGQAIKKYQGKTEIKQESTPQALLTTSVEG